MPNAILHSELNSTDPKKSIDFFKHLFPDWTWDEMPSPAGPYTVFRFAGGQFGGGGIFQNPQPGCPSLWVPYVIVDDLKATTEKLEKMGAHIHQKMHDVGVGHITLFVEPSGAITGLFQPKPGSTPPHK